jgi:hypothetical protein
MCSVEKIEMAACACREATREISQARSAWIGVENDVVLKGQRKENSGLPSSLQDVPLICGHPGTPCLANFLEPVRLNAQAKKDFYKAR